MIDHIFIFKMRKTNTLGGCTDSNSEHHCEICNLSVLTTRTDSKNYDIVWIKSSYVYETATLKPEIAVYDSWTKPNARTSDESERFKFSRSGIWIVDSTISTCCSITYHEWRLQHHFSTHQCHLHCWLSQLSVRRIEYMLYSAIYELSQERVIPCKIAPETPSQFPKKRGRFHFLYMKNIKFEHPQYLKIIKSCTNCSRKGL